MTTGLHPDYHSNTDGAEKINYEKMARIGQFGYEIAARVANLEHAPHAITGARVGQRDQRETVRANQQASARRGKPQRYIYFVVR